jgi:signal transduction histidine kinase
MTPARAARRARGSILLRLLAAFTLPAAALFVLFAVLAYEVMRDDLEAELGRRLEGIAAAAATQLRGKYLLDLAPGDEVASDSARSELYRGARRKLDELRVATGVARLYVFDREFRSRVDTAEGFPIGGVYHQAKLDRLEVERAFAGRPGSGVLFQGRDELLYKAGYAAVTASDREPDVVLAVGVDAPATFFERLAALRRQLVLYGLTLVTLLVAAAVIVATRLTRPLRGLVAAAERIGRGDLTAPIEHRGGDEIGFLAGTMDRMREDLRARDQRMQAMLAGIAHEVRNPLGAIELWTGHLRDELPADDERRGHVARIERELGYLEAIVRDFLEYARRPAPELAPIALDELVRGAVELMEPEARAAGIELTSAVDPAQVRGDPVQLRRAIINLCKNALQACAGGRGRRLSLTVRAEGAGAWLRVWNDGPAIPPEVQARLFEPFFTTREKGTGLGLAFVAEIVHDHGGRVEVESSTAGTAFTVRLPGESR